MKKFYTLLLMVVLVNSVAFSATKTIVRETKGQGINREKAIKRALAEAVAQVQGVQINSEDYGFGYSSATADIDYKKDDAGKKVAFDAVSVQTGGSVLKTEIAGLVKTYEIEAIGTSLIDGSQVKLTQQFEAALIPIFQFAVFYDNDLEIAPGPDMTLIGRVHSNGNLWVQAGTNLNMDSYVTCAGNLLHGRKGPGVVVDGNVYIKDTDGNYRNMKNADNSFLESTDSYWYDSASTRWDGRVQDAAFGQRPLNLPLNNSGDPHKLIERGSGNADSYEHLAAIKVIDGAIYAQIGGVWQDITGILPAGTVTNKSFYDAREGTNVNATEIDMSLFKSSGYYPGGGIMYASDDRSGTFNALRLTNGADLGRPLSIFSENPVYVEGNFNSVNKQPAAIAGDAVTFLSNAWADSASTLGKDSRIATPTVCNVSILTGNTNTTSTDYNGGLENLPRFLENWENVRFTWSGSMINLWNSQQANGNWNDTYYTPPIRDWLYDSDLDDPAKLPPGTPMLRVFQRTGWKQDQVGYTSALPDSI